LCRDNVQRRCTAKKHSGHRESHSGIGRKPFAFSPESLFAFSPESRSSSPRNRFHVHPGILFALPRNPHVREADAQSRKLTAKEIARVLELESDWYLRRSMLTKARGTRTGIG
jgi:hypothetical protein